MYSVAEENGWIKIRDWDRYLTSPYLLQDYLPVAVNDKMSQQDLLDAYYYVNAEFAKKKLRSKYGKHYYINPTFYQKEVNKRVREQGVTEFLRLSYKMIKGLAR